MNGSDPDSFKEQLKHLRFVHFWLVAACLLAWFVMFELPSSPIKKAQLQLKKIQEIQADWKRSLTVYTVEQATWLQKNGFTWWIYRSPLFFRAHFIPNKHPSVVKLRLLHIPLRFYIRTKRGNIKLQFMTPHEEGPQFNDKSGPWLFKTLKDFEFFWNNSDNAKVIIPMKLDDMIHIVRNNNIIEERKWNSEYQNRPDYTAGLMYAENIDNKCHINVMHNLREIAGFCNRPQKLLGSMEPISIVIPMKTGVAPLRHNLRKWLSDRFDLGEVKGRFSEQFSELHSITDKYQELELGKINDILESEIARTKDRFQAFGLTLPADTISRWIALVIIMIQLYFWVHLRQAKALTSKMENVSYPYVGFYPDRISKFLTTLSTLFLPVGSIFLVWHTTGSDNILVALAVSTLLAFLSKVHFERIHTKIGSG